MGLNDFFSGASSFLTKVIEYVVFWRNWDSFSKTMLFLMFLFVFSIYLFLKFSLNYVQNTRNSVKKHRFKRF